MNGHENNSQYVKRVVLPSGKTIEVVYFADAADRPGQHSFREVSEDTDLHRCTECSSELVYPTSWSEADGSAWNVTLRCPDCEHIREGTFSQRSVDLFDERLDEGSDALIADLRRLTRANLAEEADRFAAALAAGAILPEDF